MEASKPIIYVHSDKEGFIKCPFCGGIHRHGGNGNGIASGSRKPDCGKEEYFVVPYGKTINDFQHSWEGIMKEVKYFLNQDHNHKFNLEIEAIEYFLKQNYHPPVKKKL